jgi:outer membrane protein OmpA-like peptidoglycan-associated protein
MEDFGSLLTKYGRSIVKKLYFALSLWFFFMMGGSVGAQTALELEDLLGTGMVDYTQAARFVLGIADLVGEDSSPEAAYALALEKKWVVKKSPHGPISLGEVCFLIMNAFEMKGSFLYALFPGPRYAFRELDYLRMIPGQRDPATRVSGERLLQILGMVTAYREEPEPAQPERPEPPTRETVIAEREQIAEVIRTELAQHEVADTSVRVVDEGVVISLDNIQFLPDSVTLMDTERSKLRGIAVILGRYPERGILVGGHTALAGTAEGRRQISTARAHAVADFLISLGIRSMGGITVQGYGAERPLGDNATEEGLALNRRVEIILLDAGER